VVATAHLDEDVCSAGGLISTLGARFVPVDVLAVTNGDGTAQDVPDVGHAVELGHRRAHRPTAYHRLGSYRTRCHDLRLLSGAVRQKERVVVSRAYRVRLLQYLSAACRHEDPPPDLPWSRCRHVPLSPLQCARKLRATASPIPRGGHLDSQELFLADQIEGTAHQ
jgi:hypothetical protein